jgi:hypothetical protein
MIVALVILAVLVALLAGLLAYVVVTVTGEARRSNAELIRAVLADGLDQFDRPAQIRDQMTAKAALALVAEEGGGINQSDRPDVIE